MKAPAVTPSRIRRRLGRGLTLVELAIALVLVVTLAVLALPSFSDLMQRQRLRAAAETLAADMAEARLRAAERAKTLHITTAAGDDACWGITTGPNCDCRIAQPCRIKPGRLAEFKGVDWGATEATAFTPEGQGAGSLELRNAKGQVLRLEVSPMGRTRLCSPGGADPRHPAC